MAVLVFFDLLPLKQQAFAKCAFAKYTITGTIQDNSARKAISDATLFFFFDDNESTLSGGSKYPDFFTTDTNGVYVATAFFDTYSGGGLFGDRCNSKPKKLTVIITASGYLARRVVFHTKDLSIGGKSLDHTIELSTILLYPSKQ
jgi:hypothetical protein